MFKKFWNDEAGAVITTELVLVNTILVMGAITGLTTLRDAIVTEMADCAAAIGGLDQSYVIPGIEASTGSITPGTEFIDATDPGDVPGATSHPRCVVICSGVTLAPLAGGEGSASRF